MTAMKHIRLFPFLLAVLLTASLPGFAQETSPSESGSQDERVDNNRPNLFAELGLSPDQIQRIRRINQERRPMLMEAQRRLRMANQALDTAIYQDTVIDGEFQARLKERQAAQADLVRLRFESELFIRKILTADQLIRFRELRQKFAETRGNERRDRRMRRKDVQGLPSGGNRPLRRRPMND